MHIAGAGASRGVATHLVIAAVFLAAVFSVTGCGGDTLTNGDTNGAQCALTCDIGTEDYSIAITCESGSVTTEFNSETTEYHYDNGTRTGFTLHLNRTLTYHDTGNVYTITGSITVDEVHDTVSYSISVSGGEFTSPQSCTG